MKRPDVTVRGTSEGFENKEVLVTSEGMWAANGSYLHTINLAAETLGMTMSEFVTIRDDAVREKLMKEQ